MATREEAMSFIERIHGNPSGETFRKFNNDNAGIHCMLRYLATLDKPVSAGEISEFMNVSTARVSTLLRKMYDKGYIVRKKSTEDARKLMISLSNRGRQEDRKCTDEMIEIFRKIIDKVGKDRMEDFISVSHEIRDIVQDEIKNIDKE